MPRASSKGATWGVSHPWGHRPTRRRHWIGPKRLVIWRFAKPLLRKPAPHCGQRGQCVGCWLRSANTASTRWLVSTRATCHAARINTVREWASSTALRKRCTAGSSSCMVSCKSSIGHRSPLEPLAKESKSVPFFRCYASPPRTEMSAQRVPRVITTILCPLFEKQIPADKFHDRQHQRCKEGFVHRTDDRSGLAMGYPRLLPSGGRLQNRLLH